MGKRVAGTNLNHDNWDQEVETEEQGTFSKASEDVLKTRVIKTARRRTTGAPSMASGSGENESKQPEPAKNIFSSFGGFSGKPATTAPSFNFFQNSSSAAFSSKPVTETGGTPPKPSTSNSIFGTIPKDKPAAKQEQTPESGTKHSPEYLAKLRGLNESVSKWIQTHVTANPLCNLAPIFRDYERYFKEIEADKTPAKETASVSEAAPPKQTSSVFNNAASPNVNPFIDGKSEASKSSGFSFGKTSAAAPPAFSFGNGSMASTPAVKGFSFGGGKAAPFKFQNVASTADSTPITIEDDDDETPPKEEFKPVIEEGNVFSQRCKIFVKKAGSYTERGVGQLFLKPIPDKDKFQLIVRADTNLGNLLVNLVLSDSIPTQRMGKNNVMMVCLPLPDDKEPTSVLLRVKTTEDADELLEVLNKHKNSGKV